MRVVLVQLGIISVILLHLLHWRRTYHVIRRILGDCDVHPLHDSMHRLLYAYTFRYLQLYIRINHQPPRGV